MTVHETAMRLIRQRGTACSDPAFIAAYLTEEADKARDTAFAATKAALKEARDDH